MRNYLKMFLISLIFVFHSMVADPARSQDELEKLQLQLRQLQEKIESVQNADDDKFGERVRSIGRQRQMSQPIAVEDESLHIRFYDLSDIFSISPQYPARMPSDFADYTGNIFPTDNSSLSSGGFGGGGGGFFNMPPKLTRQNVGGGRSMNLDAARVSVNSLVEAIQGTVAPEEWKNDMGKRGKATIRVLGNTLLISATESMHKQIAGLINLFREHWGKLRTISVQAYWIRSESKAVRDLLADSHDENRMVGMVDEKRWKDFFESSLDDKRVAYSASLNGHNGQTLHTISGRQKLVVVGAEPMKSTVVTKEGEETEYVAGLIPVRHSFHEGAAIQASPLATRGGNFVILDLHARVNETIAKDNITDSEASVVVASGKQGDKFQVTLDPVEYVAYRLSTTLRCPKDQMMLAGGMTYDYKSSDAQPNLYLFVMTRVHTVEEDKSDRKMGE